MSRRLRVVVVGSGIAGLTVALRAAQNGAETLLVTKTEKAHGATLWAQGGIAAAMGTADSTAAHLADTLTAGAGLTDPGAARVLVDEAPRRIRDLIDAGVRFDRDADGALRAGLEGAHSHPRVLHAGGDATGAAIEHTLLERLDASDVEVVEHAFLAELVAPSGRVRGVDVLVDGQLRTIHADAVVLATGGAGQLYAHTTNPAVATADGIAAAIRAGARVADLEFVQFHPTVLAVGAPFLVSEAVRGEGAVLLDSAGRRFAFDAHPDGELAPRDVVARAIAAQSGPVRLDATRLGAPDTAGFLAARFPTIDAAVRERGLDWAAEPIPVTPAAHYLMGGVATDLFGRTSIPGLYAVGESARTGVHGANRLASNSLLEGAVFGARVADALRPDAGAVWPVATAGEPWRPAGGGDGAPEPTGDVARFSRAALQRLMWDDVGLVRDAAGLDRAASVLTAWAVRRPDTATTSDVTAREDENLLLVAQAVVDAAQRRETSVGAHFRRDDPGTRSDTPQVRQDARLPKEVAAC